MHTKEHIIKQLKAMNAPQNSIVHMHSSMRCIGEVDGGAKALLDTLIEYFTAEDGLFCVPTHTAGNLFRGLDITLDMAAPENDLGIISRLAIEDGRGVRSENPALSMVVFGNRKAALDFIKDEAYVTTPTAPEGCYGKLAKQNGFVMLAGVGQEKNTYLHSVAEILNIPDRMDSTPRKARVKRETGEIVDRELRMYHCESTRNVSLRFPKYEVAFRYHGCITDGFLGDAPVQFCDAAKMKDVIELIFNNSNGEDPLATEFSIPPSWFCGK